MPKLVVLLITLFCCNAANADTLDFRDCTPHSAEETEAYRHWLGQFFEDQSEADRLAESFQRGDSDWGDAPCPVTESVDDDEYRMLPNGTVVKIR